ncbi:MAG: sugar phosphate isomerase/epimerase [Mucilaginibacter polytrichastri]|nr:sugar phosphate isomerase/epimerase [Mucilaginibacter polytrichastri]
MKKTRRDFLKSSGLATAGFLVPSAILTACSSPSSSSSAADSATTDSAVADSASAGAAAGNLNDFGIQLWTVRDDLKKDPKGVLKQLSTFGFTQIESFEGEQGIFWGMGAKGFQEYTKSLNMTPISAHCDINKDFEKKAAEAASIGMKYLICPYLGAQKSLDDYKKAADTFNKRGEVCKKNGIRFAYHNHDYAFKKIEDQYPIDVFIKNTDPELVDFEMDLYWVVTAGADPKKFLADNKGRFKLVHVKDRAKDASHNDISVNESCVLGTGSINYPDILKAAKAEGVDYFIVEQERFNEGTPLECAKRDAEYMKTLSI